MTEIFDVTDEMFFGSILTELRLGFDANMPITETESEFSAAGNLYKVTSLISLSPPILMVLVPLEILVRPDAEQIAAEAVVRANNGLGLGGFHLI